MEDEKNIAGILIFISKRSVGTNIVVELNQYTSFGGMFSQIIHV